jgi:hypothetical protein
VSPRNTEGFFREFDVDQSLKADRVLQIPDSGTMVFEILQPGDASDVQIAKKLANLREAVAKKWPRSTLIAISVGYSKSAITSIIQDAVMCLDFREEDLEFKLIAEIEKFVMEHASVSQATEEDALAILGEQVRLLRGRLEKFETRESDEVTQIQQRLASETEKIARPMRAERELKTRWEILDGLSDLHQSLLEEDLVREREILYSLLVANEAHVKSTQFERLGGAYLDLVDAQALVGKLENPNPRVHEAIQLRSDLIGRMRRYIRQKGLTFVVYENPIKFSLIVCAGSLLIGVILLDIALSVEPYSASPARLTSLFLQVSGGIMALSLSLYSLLLYVRWIAVQQLTHEVSRVRKSLTDLAGELSRRS